ncbi:MAG: ABC-2 family transporter protein [Candidatus Nanohaloarchaeota archaeon QJJ-9]|nr:ABC-2 family transporter protein [Candidatus Nanohaloarchaeota archaeon QJJ-9]
MAGNSIPSQQSYLETGKGEANRARRLNMIKRAKRYLTIYWRYFKQYWKSRLVYKGDFVTGLIAQTIATATSIAFISIIYSQTRTVAGWSYYEVLFLLGYGGIIFQLHNIFFFGTHFLGDHIRTGRFDRLLLRPLDVLFQLYSQHLSDDDVSSLFIQTALLIWAGSRLGITLSPITLAYGILSILSGVMVLCGLFLAFVTVSFWSGRSDAMTRIIFEFSNFRKYPLSIYAGGIKILLTTLIPIAFASFFPATYLLQKPGYSQMKTLTLVIGPVIFFLAYRFWKFGLQHYSSTGS